jgi:predicted O-linked N-acetylglucosamine transferase (SPINDLY family)
VTPDRLELIGLLPDQHDHLAAYDKVDIALDPFPYNGTTTTCEALWMGVPVISLAGEVHAGRVGVSLLHGVGLDELVAHTTSKYVVKAIELANDPVKVSRLRKGLRATFLTSPLCDAKRFARDVESALLGVMTY